MIQINQDSHAGEGSVPDVQTWVRALSDGAAVAFTNTGDEEYGGKESITLAFPEFKGGYVWNVWSGKPGVYIPKADNNSATAVMTTTDDEDDGLEIKRERKETDDDNGWVVYITFTVHSLPATGTKLYKLELASTDDTTTSEIWL